MAKDNSSMVAIVAIVVIIAVAAVAYFTIAKDKGGSVKTPSVEVAKPKSP